MCLLMYLNVLEYVDIQCNQILFPRDEPVKESLTLVDFWLNKCYSNVIFASWEYNLTTRQWIPSEMELDKSLIIALYSAMLLVVKPRKMPRGLTHS